MTSSRDLPHTVQTGDATELGWEMALRAFLPQRYGVGRGRVIIDAEGNCSEQIDIVVYDPQFAPTFLKIDPIEVIPIESVYAVFEAKQTLNRAHVEAAKQKAKSVRRLSRHPGEIMMRGGPGTPELGRVIAGIVCTDSDWTPPFGQPFTDSMSDLVDDGCLDLGAVLSAGAFDRSEVDPSVIRASQPDNAIGAFHMALFRRLQMYGNAAAIDPLLYGAPLWSDASHGPPG